MTNANAEITELNLSTIAFRMKCRVNACLERNGGDEQVAITSSGVGISYLFASEIARVCERAGEHVVAANAKIESLKRDLATYIQMATEQCGEIERLRTLLTQCSEALDASATAHQESAKQFGFYVMSHLAKRPPDSEKAVTNNAHLTRCTDAAVAAIAARDAAKAIGGQDG